MIAQDAPRHLSIKTAATAPRDSASYFHYSYWLFLLALLPAEVALLQLTFHPARDLHANTWWAEVVVAAPEVRSLGLRFLFPGAVIAVIAVALRRRDSLRVIARTS